MFPRKLMIIGILLILITAGCSSGSGVTDSQSHPPASDHSTSPLVPNNDVSAGIKNLDNNILLNIKQTQNTLSPSRESSALTWASASSTADVTQAEQEILNYVIVQRGQDNLRVGFQNDSADKLRTLKSYGLISDIENLLWIASRGGAGIDSEAEEKMITELPVIQESCKSNIGNETIWFDKTVDSKNIWIRLNYKPFIPGQGMNAWGHRDLIVYIDTGNHNNAFLGIQDVQDPNVWKIILLPGYGPWLEKEINMLLRLTIAM